MLKVAKKKGLTVSFDGNFRSTLWSWEEARDFCTECLPYVDVLLGIEPYHLWKDENDHSKATGRTACLCSPATSSRTRFSSTSSSVTQPEVHRPPCALCAQRQREQPEGFMWYDGHTFESKLFTFNILDRVGGGDAFASGLIYAMLHNYRAMDMINFAVASSAIKHTIHGDANITDDVSTIRNLMNMNYDIKRNHAHAAGSVSQACLIRCEKRLHPEGRSCAAVLSWKGSCGRWQTRRRWRSGTWPADRDVQVLLLLP